MTGHSYYDTVKRALHSFRKAQCLLSSSSQYVLTFLCFQERGRRVEKFTPFPSGATAFLCKFRGGILYCPFILFPGQTGKDGEVKCRPLASKSPLFSPRGPQNIVIEINGYAFYWPFAENFSPPSFQRNLIFALRTPAAAAGTRLLAIVRGVKRGRRFRVSHVQVSRIRMVPFFFFISVAAFWAE